jgi:hypothetical protein
MKQKNVTIIGVVTEQEGRQLEQLSEETRSGRLGAFSLMMLSDDDIQEELKHRPLCVSDSLTDIREALEAHRWVTGLRETALNRLEGLSG